MFFKSKVADYDIKGDIAQFIPDTVSKPKSPASPIVKKNSSAESPVKRSISSSSQQTIKSNYTTKSQNNAWVDKLQFEHISLVGKAPKTQYHSAVIYKGAIYVYGGESNREENAHVFFFDGKWKKLKSTNKPLPRKQHCAVIYKDEMFVYGGSYKGQNLNDVNIFSLLYQSWRSVDYKSDQNAPKPASGHCAVVYKDKMIVLYSDGKVSEMELSEPYTWRDVKCNGKQPSDDSESCANVYKDHMYTLRKTKTQLELYSLNLMDKTWKYIEYTNPIQSLMFFDHHCEIIHGGVMLVCYAHSSTNGLGLYALDLMSKKCKFINNAGSLPSRGPYSVNVLDNELLIYGHTASGGKKQHDMFKVKLVPASNIDISSKALLNYFHNEIHSDVELILDGLISVKAHKCILSQSEVLSKLVKDTTEVEITECSSNVFLKVLHYLYTNELLLEEKDADILVDLISAADFFKLNNLKSIILNQIPKIITKSNVIQVIKKAHSKKINCIKHLCMPIFNTHSEEILIDTEEIDEDLLKEIKDGNAAIINIPVSENTLNNHLKHLYETREFSDLTIITMDGKKVKAHKVILSAFCDFFSLMLRSDFAETNQDSIELDDIDEQAMRILMEYIYCGTVNLPNNYSDLLELIQVFDFMMMQDLSYRVRAALVSQINEENVIEIYTECNENLGDNTLKERCWKLMMNMGNENLYNRMLCMFESKKKFYEKAMKTKDKKIRQQDEEIEHLKAEIRKLKKK